MWDLPSSTEISRFEFELSAMTAIFFLFSNGRVLDLLLEGTCLDVLKVVVLGGLLYKIKDGHSIPYRTQDSVPVRCKQKISLTVHRATQIRELGENKLEALNRTHVTHSEISCHGGSNQVYATKTTKLWVTSACVTFHFIESRTVG
jgi:hypothetical protein